MNSWVTDLKVRWFKQRIVAEESTRNIKSLKPKGVSSKKAKAVKGGSATIRDHRTDH